MFYYCRLDRKTKDFQSGQRQLTQVENALAELQASSSRTSGERDKLLAERKVSCLVSIPQLFSVLIIGAELYDVHIWLHWCILFLGFGGRDREA